jgi:hypothetical protein
MRGARPTFQRQAQAGRTGREAPWVPDIIASMPPAISFAEKPTLEGRLVVLRPVQATDAPRLAALDTETLRLTGTRRTYSLQNSATRFDLGSTRLAGIR